MTELTGKISVDGTVGLTCCDEIPNVLVDGASLHDLIMKMCEKLSAPLDGDEEDTNEPVYKWQIEYCTSPTEFTEETFEECSANKVADMLYSTSVFGCYSIWTCGRGGYDFLLSNKEGHSILTELNSFDGQYVWLNFGECEIIPSEE